MTCPFSFFNTSESMSFPKEGKFETPIEFPNFENKLFAVVDVTMIKLSGKSKMFGRIAHAHLWRGYTADDVIYQRCVW